MGTSGKYIEGIHACNSCGAYLFECDDCGMLNDASRNIYEPCMCPTNASFFCKCDASHARSSASAPHFKTRDGEDIPLKNISLTGPSILELFGRSRVDKTSALFGSSDQRAIIPSDIPYKEDDGRNLGDSTYLSALGDSKRTGKNILLTLNRRENDELLHRKEAELKKNQSNIAVSIPFVDSVTQRQKEVFSSMLDEVKTKAREEKVGLEEKVLELGKKIEADEMVRKGLENDIRILKHSLKYIQATKNNQTEMLDKLNRKLVQVSQQKKDLSTENSKLKSQILDNMERYSFDESESGDDSDGSIDPESFRNGLEALKEGNFISETDATNITNILLRADTEDEENIVRRLIWKLLKGQGSDEGKHDFLSSIDPLERSKIKEADFQRKLIELFNSGNLEEDEMDALMEVIDECTYGEQRDAMLSILNSVIKHYDETIQFSDNVSICYPEISGDTTRPERKDIVELIVKSLKEIFGSAFSSDQIVSGVEQMKTLLTEISAENLQTSNLIDLVTKKLEEIKDLQDKCDTKDLTSTFTEMVELVDGVKEFHFDSENKDPVWMRLLTSGDELLNEKLTTYDSLVNTLNEVLKRPVTTENVAQLKSQLDNLKTDFIEEIKTIAGYKKNIATIASNLKSVESLELFEQVKTIETRLSEFKTNLESAQTPVQELPEENEVTEVTPEIPPPPPSRAIPNPPALQRNLLSSRVSTLKAPKGEMKLIEPELYDFLLKIAGLPKEEGSGDIPHVNKSLDESSLMIPNLHELTTGYYHLNTLYENTKALLKKGTEEAKEALEFAKNVTTFGRWSNYTVYARYIIYKFILLQDKNKKTTLTSLVIALGLRTEDATIDRLAEAIISRIIESDTISSEQEIELKGAQEQERLAKEKELILQSTELVDLSSLSNENVQELAVQELGSNNVMTSAMTPLEITKLFQDDGASIGALRFLFYEMFTEYDDNNVIIAPDESDISDDRLEPMIRQSNVFESQKTKSKTSFDMNYLENNKFKNPIVVEADDELLRILDLVFKKADSSDLTDDDIDNQTFAYFYRSMIGPFAQYKDTIIDGTEMEKLVSLVTGRLRKILNLLKHSQQIMNQKKIQFEEIDSLQFTNKSINDFIDEIRFLLLNLVSLKEANFTGAAKKEVEYLHILFRVVGIEATFRNVLYRRLFLIADKKEHRGIVEEDMIPNGFSMVGALDLAPLMLLKTINTLCGKKEFTDDEVKQYLAVEVLTLMNFFTGHFEGHNRGDLEEIFSKSDVKNFRTIVSPQEEMTAKVTPLVCHDVVPALFNKDSQNVTPFDVELKMAWKKTDKNSFVNIGDPYVSRMESLKIFQLIQQRLGDLKPIFPEIATQISSISELKTLQIYDTKQEEAQSVELVGDIYTKSEEKKFALKFIVKNLLVDNEYFKIDNPTKNLPKVNPSASQQSCILTVFLNDYIKICLHQDSYNLLPKHEFQSELQFAGKIFDEDDEEIVSLVLGIMREEP